MAPSQVIFSLGDLLLEPLDVLLGDADRSGLVAQRWPQERSRIGDHPAMRGRDRFNGEEIQWVRDQLSNLRLAEPADQKRVRAALRRLGFHISDWHTDGAPFRVSDFDALVASGRIVRDDAGGFIPPGPRPIGDGTVRSTTPAPQPDPPAASVGRGDVAVWVASRLPAVLAALAEPRLRLTDARERVPNTPGLYAMYGSAETWRALGLGDPPDDRPLYVGKAEQSLVTRDLDQHFSTGTTGHSSPRRSYAALLAANLELVACPRRWPNPEPKKFHCYSLQADSDERLTRWMLIHLRLAVWPCRTPLCLDKLETAVLLELKPPLNLNQGRPALASPGPRRCPQAHGKAGGAVGPAARVAAVMLEA